MKKGDLRNFTEFTGKQLWHGCFPVDFAKFLREPSGDCFYLLVSFYLNKILKNLKRLICEVHKFVMPDWVLPFTSTLVLAGVISKDQYRYMSKTDVYSAERLYIS